MLLSTLLFSTYLFKLEPLSLLLIHPISITNELYGTMLDIKGPKCGPTASNRQMCFRVDSADQVFLWGSPFLSDLWGAAIVRSKNSKAYIRAGMS